MEAKITAILTDERGWQKPFPLGEGVYWVGSGDRVQIQLPASKDISPYHLQVVNAHNSPSVRLINLSKGNIVVQKGAESTLFAPGGIMDIFGPEIVRLGSFTLHFQLDKQNESQPAIVEGKQSLIGLRLVLPDMVLRPNMPLVGVLSLQNLGTQACQFRLDLDGIPAECYEISPLPLIFAGGEENTEIRFFHNLFAPPAGNHTVTIRVSAPDVYRDETATIQQVLKVIPYYGQSLSFYRPEEEISAVPEEIPPPASQGFEPVPQTVQMQELAPDVQPEPLLVAAPKQPPPAAIPVKPGAPAAANPVKPPATALQPSPDQTPVGVTAQAATAPVLEPEQAVPEPALEQAAVQNEAATAGTPVITTPLRRQKRPDLGSVKVMKASSGDFLERGLNKNDAAIDCIAQFHFLPA